MIDRGLIDPDEDENTVLIKRDGERGCCRCEQAEEVCLVCVFLRLEAQWVDLVRSASGK